MIYILKQDVLINSHPYEKWLSLQYAPFTTWMLPANFLQKFNDIHWISSSREDYESNPEQWRKRDYIGVLSAGTQLRYIRTVYHDVYTTSSTHPIMEIIDGPFAGKKVSAHYISLYWANWDNNKISRKGDGYDLERVYLDTSFLMPTGDYVSH